MSGIVVTSDDHGPRVDTTGIRATFRDRPIVPLLVLLGLLVVASQIARPGIVTADWIGVMIRASVPLAILAGCCTPSATIRSPLGSPAPGRGRSSSSCT